MIIHVAKDTQKVEASRKRNPSKRRFRLKRWQTILAALIGAAASIVVAIIETSGSATVASFAGPPRISITSFAERSIAHGGEEFTFTGVAENVSDADYIFVVATSPSKKALTADSNGNYPVGPWLVSPAASTNAVGKWSITWDMPVPPKKATWTAIIVNDSCNAPPGQNCAGNPYAIAAGGPTNSGVVAKAVWPVPFHSSQT
jgi:hypothetical protein